MPKPPTTSTDPRTGKPYSVPPTIKGTGTDLGSFKVTGPTEKDWQQWVRTNHPGAMGFGGLLPEFRSQEPQWKADFMAWWKTTHPTPAPTPTPTPTPTPVPTPTPAVTGALDPLLIQELLSKFGGYNA